MGFKDNELTTKFFSFARMTKWKLKNTKETKKHFYFSIPKKKISKII